MNDFSWLRRFVARAGLASSLLCAGSVAFGQTLLPSAGTSDRPTQFTLNDPNVILAAPISGAMPSVLAMRQPGAVVPAGYVASPAAQPMTTIGPTPPPQPMIGAAAAVAPPSVFVQSGIIQPSVVQPSGVAIAAVPAQQNCGVSSCGPSNCACASPSIWYVNVESLFLWRDNPFPATAASDFDVGVGPKIIGRLRANDDWSVEAAYFGVFGMVGDAHGNNGVNFYDREYQSDINNAEASLVATWNSLSILAGFRYLRLAENFDWRVGQLGVDPDVLYGHWNSNAQNNLAGGQLGARWRHDGPRFFGEATAKVGIFGNDAYAASDIHTRNPDTGSHFTLYPTVKGTGTSFIGDLNFSSGLRLNDFWTVRTGYNLLWINGVSLAFDRVGTDLDPIAPLYLERHVFLHGVDVGLEETW